MNYIDRNGKSFRPEEADIVRPRHGAFCIFVCDQKVLVNLEDHAPENPSLPGGGVDEGETEIQAAKREFLEETGIECPDLVPDKDFSHDIYLYADDVNEYWDYHQTYFLFPITPEHDLYFQGQKPNPCGMFSFWEDLDKVRDSKIHHIHKHAIIKMLGL